MPPSSDLLGVPHIAPGATLFDAPAEIAAPAVRPAAFGPRPARGTIPALMCVLASGSAGNCTVLRLGDDRHRRIILIDAGLGTRTTARALATLGVRLHDVTDVLLTHLDSDHWRPAWLTHRDFRAVIHLHKDHWPGAQSLRGHRQRVRLYEGPFRPVEGLDVEPLVQHHDEHGVVIFRLRGAVGDIGFATDLGRVTPELIEHLRGVSVLAIESNYCPRLQVASARPQFLKDRIMGGSGHLSNHQCAQAARAIDARHVVLLHLSRQCNTPDLALEPHAGRSYAVTLTSQTRPTGWLDIPAC